jgi:hypothetical protein
MTEKNLNEIDEWWVGFLADQTELARAHAERMFRRNADKKEIFMSAFHWAMVNARPEIWARLTSKTDQTATV